MSDANQQVFPDGAIDLLEANIDIPVPHICIGHRHCEGEDGMNERQEHMHHVLVSHDGGEVYLLYAL